VDYNFKKINIKQYLNDEVVDYASYTTLRQLTSIVDGLKNASRKVINTITKTNGEVKVEILSGTVSVDNEYLHGPSNLNDVIVNLAKDYPGTNNIPLLTREGNFGKRFKNEASAARYIYTEKEKVLGLIYKKEDNNILIKQNFEGTDIEPRYYVPIIPMLLVNGSLGMATGFKQVILPRDPKKITKFLIKKLENNDLVYDIPPSFTGLKCDIVENGEHNKWEIIGKYNIKNTSTIEVVEIPPKYDLSKYRKVLDELEDNGDIVSYNDMSNDDKFLFVIKMNRKTLEGMDNKSIISLLKLSQKTSELYNSIDRNNRVFMYKNVNEIMNDFYDIRLEYYSLRKEHQIETLKNEINLNISRYMFVDGVIKNLIDIKNSSKEEIINIIKQIDKIEEFEGSYDYLLRMPIYSMSKEKMKELKDKVIKVKDDLIQLINTDIKSTWKQELEELFKAL
jgi:DNA topoisomerase-2